MATPTPLQHDFDMALERSSSDGGWNGSVPTAFDARVLALVGAVAAFAASVNLPYGGLPAAVAAFGLLASGGVVGHVLGERRLRRLTDDLVAQWAEAGGRIHGVSRSSAGIRTEWTVHTPSGPITVGGLALAPITRLSIDWQGTGDAFDASEVEARLDSIGEEWYREVFEIQ